MAAELDHAFLLVSAGADPEAAALAALGLREGQPNRHPGQGTACRRFFFANAYLELLWVEDRAETQGGVAGPLRFWERGPGRAAGACPFGLIFRCGPLPFPTWEYRPPYLPPPQALHVGANSDHLEEPLLFCFWGGSRPDQRPLEQRQPLDHPAGLRELTAARISGPHAAAPSAALRAAAQIQPIAFLPGSEHLAELGFDGERQGRRADLRPALPLVLCW